MIHLIILPVIQKILWPRQYSQVTNGSGFTTASYRQNSYFSPKFVLGLILVCSTFRSTGATLYVGNYDNAPSTISKISSDGTVSVFASGVDSPGGLAFDASGSLFVANVNLGTVSKINPFGAASTFASGFSSPHGLAFDSLGQLYVSNVASGEISKVTSTGLVSTYATGLNHPIALAFASNGDLFAATNLYQDQSIYRITSGGIVSLFAGNLQNPISLAFDQNDNLYVLENGVLRRQRMTISGRF